MTGAPPDIEAVYSTLVVDCKMSFDQIGRLTDAQIYDVVFRPRDEKGQVMGKSGSDPGVFDVGALGELPDTPENQLKAGLLLAGMLGSDPEKVKAQWEAKHGKKADEALASL